MNTSKIKSYAIQARRDFLKAVTERANIYGIFSDDHIEPIDFKGDMAIIGERAFTKKEGELREKLVGRVKRYGFAMVMRSCAYTWFNRFVAIRYMEVHGYLEHSFRVLSNSADSVTPEILEHAADIEFQSIDKDKVIELKLAGTKDNELYRLLILAQCDDLHKSMPFLFDRIDNETELLLPDNLLHSDSPIRKMVSEIEESDWNDVEIIGWIYQYYISERKDEVIGKVVQSEDIPAATQLFTPNWIVKYMVQNTLGRMWLATYPDSALRDKMEYYIEPAEQEPEVDRQLDEIMPKELNPEEITFLDPACGSGHIMIEAYDVFREIYLERGYRTKDIPRLILGKNIFGMDICDRAAQLAYFAVLMKARKDDRRIFGRDDLKLNVVAIQESKPSDERNIGLFFKGDESKSIRNDLKEIVSLFEKGKTYGSLITVPDNLVNKMESIVKNVDEKISRWVAKSDVQNLRALVTQARFLSKNYDCIVSNPPYMGANYMNSELKDLALRNFTDEKSDLFSMFIDRILGSTATGGLVSLMTPFTWMNLTSYSKFRLKLLSKYSLRSLIKPEYHAFFDSAYVPVCTFTIQNYKSPFTAAYIDLSRFYGEHNQAPNAKIAIQNPKCDWRYERNTDDFLKVPLYVIAYSLSSESLKCFNTCEPLKKHASLRQGLITGKNERFLRFWHEIDLSKSSLVSSHTDAKWFPYQKGGAFRKWYGNNEYFVNWANSGSEICSFKNKNGKLRSRPQNIRYYFKEGITWTSLTISQLSMRYVESGYIFDAKGPMCFPNNSQTMENILGYSNSKVVNVFLKELAPTMDYSQGPVGSVPFIAEVSKLRRSAVREMIKIAKADWDSFETSWSFQFFPWLIPPLEDVSINASVKKWHERCSYQIRRMQELETENNRIYIKVYKLQNDLTPEVSISEITLMCNPHYRYSGQKSREELEKIHLNDTIKELISYGIGCMMGRYSLDLPGVIYANSGRSDIVKSKYKTYIADDDGIIPVMDMDWFTDDATRRFIDFLQVAWSPEALNENIKFVADCLKPKRNETPTETIRRYLSTTFFKDHLKKYKKRPIYWLFSSGKQKAFECLVYLHRYNESTLSRMRSTYVTPLQSNFSSRLEFLKDEKDASSTTSEKNKNQKEIDKLRKKQTELSNFDDELRHYADMKISLDLDDGVKVNYGNFGKLLAEKKAVTGKK